MPKPTRFCHYCGHGPLNIAKTITCSDCHAEYPLIKAIKKPTITLEEAETLFSKKELTERQKYGTVGKKRWRSKK